VAKKKAECEGTKFNVKRIKRNLSFAIRTNCCCGDEVVFKNAVETVLEHHFSNHSLCGGWCRVKSLEGAELAEAMLKYRSKEKNNKLYLQVKTIFEEFYLLLFEMLHPWDTNIVEGLNKFFTKFLHKDRTYAMTIENKVRIYLAVAIDSIGYSETYERIAEKTGLTFCAVQKELDLQLDETKSYRRSYQKKPAVKIKHMAKFNLKMAEGKRKLVNENRKGLQYSSGMSGPFAEDSKEQSTNEEPTVRKKRRKTRKERKSLKCGHCGIMGHLRTSSKDCLKNKRNVAHAKNTEVVEPTRKKGTSSPSYAI
jgi:hypothetical protein